MAILLRELKRRISMGASLFRALKQTRVHNIANIYREQRPVSQSNNTESRYAYDLSERRIFHYERFLPPPLPRFLINTIRGRNADGARRDFVHASASARSA